jgi:hypothetical protein
MASQSGETIMSVVQRKQLHSLIDALPDYTLVEVQDWLQSFGYRHRSNGGSSTPYVPVALGGLWKGDVVDDDAITAVRRDMTRDFLAWLE